MFLFFSFQFVDWLSYRYTRYNGICSNWICLVERFHIFKVSFEICWINFCTLIIDLRYFKKMLLQCGDIEPNSGPKNVSKFAYWTVESVGGKMYLIIRVYCKLCCFNIPYSDIFTEMFSQIEKYSKYIHITFQMTSICRKDTQLDAIYLTAI